MFKTCKKPPMSIISASGSICTFNALQSGLPLKSHTVSLVAKQAAGTPSPSYPKSITGWDSINIVNQGKNLFNMAGLLNATGWTKVDNNTYTGDNRYIAYQVFDCYKNCVYFDANTFNVGEQITTSFTLGGDSPTSIYVGYVIYNTQTGVERYQDTGNITTLGNVVFTSNCSSVEKVTGIYFSKSSLNAILVLSNFQIERGSEATEYTPYDGQSITIQIGSTVYGGEYDARTGVLTVKYKYFSFDYTTPWAYEYSGGGRNFYYICPSDIKAGQTAINSNMMCSASPISTILGAQKDSCFISNSRNFNYTWGDTLDISTAQDFKDYLQANNIVIEVVAELATPTTIQLPPCPIDTLEGQNNIWADTGNTSLEAIKIGR